MSLNLLIMVENKPGQFTVRGHGAWTSHNANRLENGLRKIVDDVEESSTIRIDVSRVTRFDTFGAWLLERLRRELAGSGDEIRITGMKKEDRPLFKELGKISSANEENEDLKPRSKVPQINTKSDVVKLSKNASSFMVMFGASVSAMLRLIIYPHRFRLTSTIYQFDRVAWQALPIILLVTFIIGAIIAQQGFFHFRQFGAELYVVDMVGFLIMREIGVLLVAIVIAGRSGSSFTAELGSMKMSEEIDALKTMGFNPVDVLILPRIIVLVFALPVLTFIGSVTALFGAGLVAVYYGGISAELYIDRLKDVISIDHFTVGMIKAPFIGAVIGIIACTEGLQVRGSATSLGKHTTQSVVKSIFMVILLDGLFALFFSGIRM